MCSLLFSTKRDFSICYRLSFTIVLKHYCVKIQNFLLTNKVYITYDNYRSNRIL